MEETGIHLQMGLLNPFGFFLNHLIVALRISGFHCNHFPIIKGSSGKNLQIGFEQISEKKTMKILFSDEKYSDIDGAYNSQDDRVWVVNRADADEKGGVKQRRKVMVWLSACSNGLTLLVIFNEGTVDHAVYIEKVLPIALKYGNEVLDSDRIFQQDGAKPHSHYLTQQWCRDLSPSGRTRTRPGPGLKKFFYRVWIRV